MAENDRAEIRIDTRIKTDILIKHDRPDIFVYDKKMNTITLIEVGITSQDQLQEVETEKKRKYDILANEISLLYKAKTRIIPYVMTWDGVVTKFHRNYVKELKISKHLEAYIQSLVLKKTLETISLERRRAIEDGTDMDQLVERSVDRICGLGLNISTGADI